MNKRFIFLLIALATVCTIHAGTNNITSLLQKGLFEEEANHNLEAAMQAYQSVIAEHDKDRKLAATAVFRLGECFRKQGKTNEAALQYQRIMREFTDQEQLVKLSEQYLGGARQISQATGTVEPKLQVLDSLYQEVAAKLLTAKSLFERVGRLQSREELENFFTIIQPDDQLKSLIRGRIDRLDMLSKISKQYGPDHPDVKAAEATVTVTDNEVKKRIEALTWASRNDYEALQIQKAELQKQLDEIKQTASKTATVRTDGAANTIASDQDQAIRDIKALIQNSPDLIDVADCRFKLPSDNQEWLGTRLHQAAAEGQLEVARYLLDNKADVNSTKSTPHTPLYFAVRYGHKAMVNLLLDHGADINKQPNDAVLVLACDKGFAGVAEVLLNHKANVNQKNGRGQTALMFAISREMTAIRDRLLAGGADIEAIDSDGQTPLFYAAWGDGNSLKILLDRGAKVDVRAKDGRSPLVYASPRTIPLLINAGVDINLQDSNEGTALRYCILQSDDNDRLLALLKQKPNLEIPDAQGYTPLSLATKARMTSGKAEILLEAGGNPNAKTEGETPIFWILRSDPVDKKLLQSFLSHGADVNIINR